MNSKLYDVVVIGAGPAGNQVAYRLAGMGYSVLVLEQKEHLGEPVCCTGIVSRQCVEDFAIDEAVILRRVNGAEVFSPSGRLLSLWRAETQACILDRPALNVALAKRAQTRGAWYLLDSRVSTIEVGIDGVTVDVDGYEGVNRFESRVAVIATGFSSRLSEELGLGRVGDFVLGVQATVPTAQVSEVEVYFGREIAPAFFAWLVPVSSGVALAGLLSRRNPGLYLRRFLDFLAANGKVTSADVELRYGGIRLRPLAKTYGDRVVVVGTAAGQVKPTTGGGVYYGLLCADIAADNLHTALRSGDLSARSLASYERSWKRTLGRELRVGYWARKLFEHLQDSQVDQLFDIIRSNGIMETLLKADDLTFDSHGLAVLRMVGHTALSGAIKTMKIPASLLKKLKIRNND
jgi:geranylgeranyl reductase family protein